MVNLHSTISTVNLYAGESWENTLIVKKKNKIDKRSLHIRTPNCQINHYIQFGFFTHKIEERKVL